MWLYTTCGNIPVAADSLTIMLNELNDSGQSGWATLTAVGDQTQVVLSISSGNLETELVHIHSGQCGDALGAGTSVSTVEVPLNSLRTGDFAINSHKKE